jgi:hypothetical protein
VAIIARISCAAVALLLDTHNRLSLRVTQAGMDLDGREDGQSGPVMMDWRRHNGYRPCRDAFRGT